MTLYFFFAVRMRLGSYRILICLFGLFPLILFLVWRAINAREDWEQRWKFLSETFKFERLPQRLFVLFYLVRMILVNIIISYFENYARIQAILMMLLSFGILYYLVWTSPFQKKIDNFQCRVIEIALFLYHIILAILGFLDGKDNKDIIFGQLIGILYLTTPVITTIQSFWKF